MPQLCSSGREKAQFLNVNTSGVRSTPLLRPQVPAQALLSRGLDTNDLVASPCHGLPNGDNRLHPLTVWLFRRDVRHPVLALRGERSLRQEVRRGSRNFPDSSLPRHRAGDSGRSERRSYCVVRPATCNHIMLPGRSHYRIHIPPSQKRRVMSKATAEPLTMHRLRNDNRPPARKPVASESNTSTPPAPDPPCPPNHVRIGVHRNSPHQNIRMPVSDHEASGSVGSAQ